MSGFDFTTDEEDRLQRELDEADNRILAARSSVVTPQLSQNLANFYQQYPSASPAVLIPAARAYTDGRMTEEQAREFLGTVVKDSVLNKIREYGASRPKEKSWWERNVADKFKTGARYTFAGLNFVPQAITNLTSQSYQVGKSLDISDFDFDGFFISTDIGSLIANDEVAGEGYFIGGRAAQLQAERARAYRGTIDGQAFTMGRGIAKVVAQPGSEEYRRLSGIVDAAAALFIPAAPGAGVVKGAVAPTLNKTGLRALAGLTEGASAGINPAKVADFFNSNSGRKILGRMSEIKSIDESLEIFPTADLRFHKELVDISADQTLDAVQKQDRLLRFVNDTLGAGDPTRGIGPRSIDDINISRWDDLKLKVTQTRSLPATLMAKVPGRHVIISGGNDYDLLQSVKNVQNYMKILRVAPEKRAEIVEKLTKALVDGGGDARNAVDEIYNTIGDALRNMGVSDELNNALRSGIKEFKDAYDKDLYGFIDDQGKAYSFADMGAKFVDMDGNLVDAPLATAGIQSEMLKHALFLPDPRRVRRIANSETGVASLLSWVGTKQGLLNPENFGDLRMPLVVVEALQNYVWRPLTLLTGGYVLRNMTDSLLRQSFSPNLQTGVFHPWELIQLAMHKRFKGDIEGILFQGDPETLIRNGQQELVEATSGSLREGLDPIVRQSRERATGVWRRVRIGDGKAEYRNALAAEVALLHGDEVARKYAQGWSTQEIIDWMRTNPDGRLYVKKLQGRWSNRTLNNSATGELSVGTVKFIDEAGELNVKNLETYINRYIANRVEVTTGGSSILKRAIGDGEVELADGTLVGAFRKSKTDQIIGYNDDFLESAMGVIDDPAIQLKEYYKSQVYAGGPADAAGNALDRAIDGYNRMVNLFFSELYPKREAFLNRSPAFRQFYYQSVDRFLDELAPGQAKRIVDNIKKAINDSRKGTRNAGKAITDKDVARYIGDGDIASRVLDRASGRVATKGNLTIEQVSAYAKGYALDETKRLFYNAAEKSNFADILRVIAPFGSAWYEVSKRWLSDMTRNPEILKRGAVTVQGLKNADPDGDGKGFFFRDPQTGEYVFNYPFSEQLAPFMLGLTGAVVGGIGFGAAGIPIGAAIGGGAGAALQPQLEGVNTVLSAPARTLSMGLNFMPGVGPVAQVAANKIIPDKPKYDFVRSLIAPYGEPELGVVTKPAWFDKLWAAAFADPENDRIFGDMVIDTMRALSVSGKYDLTRATERDRLEQDAKAKARVLLTLRALGQFTGPTRPTVEFTINTKEGDVYASELAKIFRQYQAEDFDTAVPRFLDTFGEDVFLYVAGKTRANAGGLSASKEFGRWERDNEGVFNTYPDVAGYFAPVGSNFDYRVYLRQIESGMLERLSPDELIKEAQSLVGKSVYRFIVRAIGPNPNQEQRTMLSGVRDELEAQFPGFAEAPLDINRFDRQVNQLREAANDPRLSDNPVAQALQVYMQARDAALQAAQARGFRTITGLQTSDLRGQLRQVGEILIQQFPEFERLYDRVLFNEIDLDVEVQGGS
jgi:hypothetical protein